MSFYPLKKQLKHKKVNNMDTEINTHESQKVFEFYEYWVGRKAWSFEQSCSLFMGKTPLKDFVDSNFVYYGIGRRPPQINLIENSREKSFIRIERDEIIYFDEYGRAIYFDILLALAEAVGDIQSYKFREVIVYKPQDIIKWIINNTSIAPPKPLIDILFKDEVKCSK